MLPEFSEGNVRDVGLLFTEFGNVYRTRSPLAWIAFFFPFSFLEQIM